MICVLRVLVFDIEDSVLTYSLPSHIRATASDFQSYLGPYTLHVTTTNPSTFSRKRIAKSIGRLSAYGLSETSNKIRRLVRHAHIDLLVYINMHYIYIYYVYVYI